MPVVRCLVMGLLLVVPLCVVPGVGATAPAPAHASGDASGHASSQPSGPRREPRAAAACSRLDTSQPGIGRRTVRLGNVVDESGPVPGLFLVARQAAQAAVAHFNSRADVCGRRVVLDTYDSRTDSTQDQRVALRMCEADLAAVASMSAFDDGGAAATEACGLPDLRVESVTAARRECATCFAVHPTEPGTVSRATHRHLARTATESVARSAFLYRAGGDTEAAARAGMAAAAAEGWDVRYAQAIPPATVNYLPYALELQSRDIRVLSFHGGPTETARMQEAMRQVELQVDVLLQDGSLYTDEYPEWVGESIEPVRLRLSHTLLEGGGDRELGLYRRWLERVHPGAEPDPYGLFAWSATRLLLRQLVRLRGDLDRTTLVRALARIRTWDGRGLHAPQSIGTQRVSRCELLAAYDGERWVQASPGDYVCGPLARAATNR